VSVSHFDRTFRRAFDTSPRQYLIRIRIEAACRKLAETTESLAAIALACGFHDHAHFTRSFHRIMAATPSAYRAAHQNPVTQRRGPR
jgi:AraC-like DNA-binding protein